MISRSKARARARARRLQARNVMQGVVTLQRHRASGIQEQVQIISHGLPVSHVVITDAQGGAVQLPIEFLPSVQEVLATIPVTVTERGPTN